MKVKIREFARSKGLSLYKLAQMLSLPQQTLYSWGSGRTQPSYDGMDMLCTVLQCNMADLFEPEEKAEYSLKKRLEIERRALTRRAKEMYRLEMGLK